MQNSACCVIEIIFNALNFTLDRIFIMQVLCIIAFMQVLNNCKSYNVVTRDIQYNFWYVAFTDLKKLILSEM